MLRRVMVAAVVFVLVILTTAAGLAGTWPECLEGCTAKDVEVIGAYLTEAGDECDLHLLIQAKRQKTYCVVLTGTAEFGTESESFEFTIGFLSGGIHDLVVATIDCESSTDVSVSNIYIAWSPNKPDDECLGTCGDYGPGSKCNGTTPDIPAITGRTILVIKDASPDFPASFAFGGDLGAFTLIDDGSGGNTQQFDDLDGTYIIYENSLADWTLENITVSGTADLIGYGPDNKGDYDVNNFNSGKHDGLQIEINDDQDFAVITFENSIDSGTISVTKYEDLNRNGVRNTSPSLEPALADWTIEVYQGTGCGGSNTLVASGTTAADGTISFELPVGTYYITEQLPSGWTNTDPGDNPPCVEVEIEEDEDEKAVIFGNAVQLGSISVHKYNDLNGNGSDDTEPALEGWTITLHSDSGCQTTEIASGVTDSSGNVTFSSLTPGTYYVSEALQAGWQNTEPGTGSTAPCVEVTLSPGGSPSVDLGNQQIPGSISVYKYNDLNGNGSDDAEPALEGWAITLHSDSGCQTPAIASGTTNASGNVTFSSLTPGTYYVSEALQAGWQNTEPGTGSTAPCVEVTLSPGGSPSVNLGNQQIPGSISVHKFDDLDGNGTQGTGEPNIEGWSFSLYSGSGCSGDPIATGATDADGDATFSSLTPGDYSVGETLAAGWENTAGGTCQNTTLEAGGCESLIFGNRLIPGSISVHKYNDLDGSGTQDVGEPDIEGWTITLHSEAGCQTTEIASAVTDSSGDVTFSGLAPGTYYVGETLQSGWENTDPGTSPPCVEVTLTAEGSPSVNLGNRELPGAITIQKVTLTSTTDQFTFNHDDIGGQTTFDLGNGGTEVFGSVTPGTYVFTEQALAGWSILSIDQSSGDASVRFGSSGSFHDTYQAGDNQVEITVGANQSALIVFTNEQSQQEEFGSITVTKDVVPDDASTWTITLNSADPQILADGGSYTYTLLDPGDYTVAESGPPGYDPFVDAGSDGSAAATSFVINIGPGDAKTVAFTNTLQGQQNGGGGGGGGGASSGCYNNNPIPNAGPDQVGCVGQRICLDGSSSYDPDEDLPLNYPFPNSGDVSPMYRHQPRETLRFGWTFAIHHYENGRAVLDIPRGSRVLETIEGFDTEFPCFTPDLPGRYTLVLTVTDDYGASLMDRVTVIVEECDHLETRRFLTGWQLVSAPLQPAETSSQPMSGIQPSAAFQLHRYVGEYIQADSFALGVGYWMYVAEPFELSITGLPVEGSFSIRLQRSGWHLIGTPFAAAWDQTSVEYDRLTRSMSEAASRGVIEDLCIGLAPDGSYTQVDVLMPWNGYWIYSHEPDVVLHFRELTSTPSTLFWTAPPAALVPPGPPQLAAGGAQVSISPNPSHHQPIVFRIDGLLLVDEIRVRIFNIAGRLIWSETATGRELTWDGIRSDGHEAARGAYLYVVEVRSEDAWSVVAQDVLVLAPGG